MATANEELLSALVRHQIYLIRYSGSVRNKITELLGRSEADVADKIKRYRAPANGLTTPAEYDRMKALQSAVAKIRQNSWGEAQKFFDEQMNMLMYQEPVVMRGIIDSVLPVTVSTVMPSANLLQAMVMSKPFEGRIMSKWVGTLAQNEVLRMNNAIQLGMVAGESMDQIAKRVTGSAALKGSDGVTELTRHQITAVTRTAVMHVSNNARSTFFQQNKDIIKVEQFVATLDSRTTAVCRAYDGNRYPLGEGPIPPLHYGCRSLRVVAFNDVLLGSRPAKPTTEKILVKEYAEKHNLGDVRDRDSLPRGTKGPYDAWAQKRIRELVGPVPASTVYQKFLEGQSPAFQNEVLGIAKGKLFRDGGLTLDKYIDRAGNELTLAQMAGKYREAFVKAGLDPAKYF